jgi:starch synthase (maltosyl-transferring)
MEQDRKRVIIENVQPEIDGGSFPIKRAIGENVTVKATIFTDAHDSIAAVLLVKDPSRTEWTEFPMKHLGNDLWTAEFVVARTGEYRFTIEAWVDHFQTWQKDLKKRREAGQDLQVQLQIGAHFVEEASQRAEGNHKSRLIEIAANLTKPDDNNDSVDIALGSDLTTLLSTYTDRKNATRAGKELVVIVEREKALFSTWYERFPRSCSSVKGKHGTFMDCIEILPEIARMGFDTWYLPPIHPIGRTNRKGKNNSPKAEKGDVGSPWAIGAKEGGHKAIHPDLGSMEDFKALVAKAKELGIEIALDLAYQCSPDHPYVKAHPEWFRWLPDGTVQYAENPPKKYEDVLPFNFETDQWKELWEELKSVVLFWAGNGVRIFRVDNPHTKPFRFWEWLIRESRKEYPDLLFLAEAFTRPNVMYYLAKAGFTQSYTYFTWRNTKPEITDYVLHLLNTSAREFFRPNFWPNTPDILPEHLQYGGRPVYMMRLVLAATMASSYGIYGPAFELAVKDAVPGKEEYLNSEKYELVHWDWNQAGNLKDFISRVNKIRRENPALQTTWNLRFYSVDNEYLLFYGKSNGDLSNIILVVVNLDPAHTQSGWVHVPLHELGLPSDQPYLVHELLTDDKYIWHGERNYVELNPSVSPAHIFRVRKRMKKETDFDYYL